MSFLNKKEKNISNKFLENGFIIGDIENNKSLELINKLIKKKVNKILNLEKNYKFDYNYFHKLILNREINDKRVKIINSINSDKNFRLNYFNLAREHLYALAGNELMMQKRINLSIQVPNDESSLLPVHSDVWSGDSPYEIVLWTPMVDCFKTKSMYILKQKDLSYFMKRIKKKDIKSSNQIFDIIKNKIKWINIKYGQFLIFNQTLPHGNVVNTENETRWSLNCRFKSIFSPYSDKKIGEFFTPITTRATTKIGLNFKFPF